MEQGKLAQLKLIEKYGVDRLRELRSRGGVKGSTLRWARERSLKEQDKQK